MLSETTKIDLRMRIENELFNAMYSSSKGTGMEAVLYFLDEAPSVLNEIIQKYRTNLDKSFKDSPCYDRSYII